MAAIVPLGGLGVVRGNIAESELLVPEVWEMLGEWQPVLPRGLVPGPWSHVTLLHESVSQGRFISLAESRAETATGQFYGGWRESRKSPWRHRACPSQRRAPGREGSMSEVKAPDGWWRTGSRSSNSAPGSTKDRTCLRITLSFGWKARPQSLSLTAPLSSARLRAKPFSCVPTVSRWKADTQRGKPPMLAHAGSGRTGI